MILIYEDTSVNESNYLEVSVEYQDFQFLLQMI
jgi:hypothetical protein